MINVSSLPFIGHAGLGLRRALLSELKIAKENHQLDMVDFFELSPENWIKMGGKYHETLLEFSEYKPIAAHGLSLSIGSAAPLNEAHLQNIKKFLDTYHIERFSEHLSWCADDGQLYDLLPIPLNEESVHWIAKRIQRAQEILERPMGLENASVYFTPPNSTMTEAEFISAVVAESGCYLHLDVNNVFVNSHNFQYDPYEHLCQLPLEKTGYMHIAGHYTETDGFLIDTHGMPVIDTVWQLLDFVYQRCPQLVHQAPVCLERDSNFPPLGELLAEVARIHRVQQPYLSQSNPITAKAS